MRDLRTYFHVMDGVVRAVDGVSFSIRAGETLGLVGESGCGKSVTALSIMRLHDMPPAEIPTGEILFEGRDLLALSEDEMRQVRGNDIAMIFQEPMTSLNPVFTVGDQIAEAVILHQGLSKKAAWEKAVESLKAVGINDPERRVKQYPHEMSGGMRQRVMIAMALSCDPKLLIADEPTTALDVTIQAQILELIREVQDRTGAALLLITHDLGVVAETVRRRRRDVRRPDRRAGRRERGPARPEAPLHRGPARVDPVEGQARRAAQRHPGHRAEPVQHAARLQLRAALPVRLRAVHRARPADRGGGPARSSPAGCTRRRRAGRAHRGSARGSTSSRPLR